MIEILLLIKSLIYANAIMIENNKGYIVILTFLISSAIFSLISSKSGDKKKRNLTVLYSLISLLMFANAVYFSYFNALLSVNLLSQARQINTVKNSILHLLSLNKIMLLADIPVVYYYLSKKEYNLRHMPKSNTHRAIFMLILVMGVFLARIGE
ncbi:MAG: hypothetical protein H5U39_06440, partial [Deferribacterales bacterium]|nr:hypothetical protein [Deferribacterales bacterium]